MGNTEHKGGKKNRKWGRQKRSPAFQRYWSENLGKGRIYGRKVRNLMRHCGMTRREAMDLLDKR